MTRDRTPGLFIGSSSEGIDFARAARSLLEDDADITVWNEEQSGLGEAVIERLVDARGRFDFALIILSEDDLIVSRERESLGPRDNVVFELGLFMGHLGRERTFIVRPVNPDVETAFKIPSDIFGVITADYRWPRKDGNHTAALGAACDKVRHAIRRFGPIETIGEIARRQTEVSERQHLQDSKMREFELIVPLLLPKEEQDHLKNLAHGQTTGYTGSHELRSELRRLRSLGLIEMTGQGYISDITDDTVVDLAELVRLKDLGSQWVERLFELEEHAQQDDK
jgi:hypothetical protein